MTMIPLFAGSPLFIAAEGILAVGLAIVVVMLAVVLIGRRRAQKRWWQAWQDAFRTNHVVEPWADFDYYGPVHPIPRPDPPYDQDAAD